MNKINQPSILKLFLTTGILIFSLFYFVVTVSTSDPLWFYLSFEHTSYEIVLNCFGEEIFIPGGSDDHKQLTAFYNKQLSGIKRWDQLTLSDETREYYSNSDDVVIVEFRYSPNARIHSAYSFFKNVDTLISPLVGRHSKTNPVFGATRGISTSGSFHVEDFDPIRDYIHSEGICLLPSIN